MPSADHARIEVRATQRKGRGVFARGPFAAGELIEVAPVVPLPKEQLEAIRQTVLGDFPFDWSDGTEALVMGLGSFYNHSYEPNARYVKRYESLTVEFYAVRAIAAGEEIMTNYNGAADDRSPLWFAVDA
jgi:SET domain-containing protein